MSMYLSTGNFWWLVNQFKEDAGEALKQTVKYGICFHASRCWI